MEKIDRIHRWRPLLIGICSVLIVSTLLALFNGIHYGVGAKVIVQMWLLMLSGFFAGIVVTIRQWHIPVIAMLNLLLLFSYSIWPSKTTKVVTVFGFIWWQFFGWVFGTLILFGGYPGHLNRLLSANQADVINKIKNVRSIQSQSVWAPIKCASAEPAA